MPHNTSTMPIPLIGNLEEFRVSQNGFLPEQLPLRRLTESYYESWETVLDYLPNLLATASLRDEVNQLEVLSTSRLASHQEWQRAYLILSFLTHSYIWEAGGPSERLPPSITVPFLQVASHLGLPPTATYAALNLWNFTVTSSSTSLNDADNLRALHTFTGTRDEEWFYLISAAMESHGASIIPTMLSAMDAIHSSTPDCSALVTSSLIKFSQCIRGIGEILKRMDEHCNPDVFYNKIRPFLAGSKNMAVAGLTKGVFYDEGEGKGQWRQYSGGSNAQSSMIQFLDVVLGVEHSLTGAKKGSKPGFLTDMRTYMPGPHRAFLQHVESVSNIRAYASNPTTPAELGEAYNNAVEELSKFRDIHIQIVTRYIINPSRRASPTKNSGMNLAVASTNSSMKGLHGTGGTALLPFLKQSRDETKETALNKEVVQP